MVASRRERVRRRSGPSSGSGTGCPHGRPADLTFCLGSGSFVTPGRGLSSGAVAVQPYVIRLVKVARRQNSSHGTLGHVIGEAEWRDLERDVAIPVAERQGANRVGIDRQFDQSVLCRRIGNQAQGTVYSTLPVDRYENWAFQPTAAVEFNGGARSSFTLAPKSQDTILRRPIEA